MWSPVYRWENWGLEGIKMCPRSLSQQVSELIFKPICTWHQNLWFSCHIVSLARPRLRGFSSAETIRKTVCLQLFQSSPFRLIQGSPIAKWKGMTYLRILLHQLVSGRFYQPTPKSCRGRCSRRGRRAQTRVCPGKQKNKLKPQKPDGRPIPGKRGRWDKAVGCLKTHRSHSAFLNTANLMHEFSQRKLRYLTRPKDSSKYQCVLEQCYSTFNAEPRRKALRTSCFLW